MERKDVISGLRELADALELTETTPMPRGIDACVFVQDRQAFIDLSTDGNYVAGYCGDDLLQLTRVFSGGVQLRIVVALDKMLLNPGPKPSAGEIIEKARQQTF